MNLKEMGNYEIVYGAHPIIELLKAKRRHVLALYTTKPTPKAFERLVSYLPKNFRGINYVTKDALDRMAGGSDHMGVVACASPFKFASKIFNPAQKPFILLLDSIQDVRNLGAILRSSYCTGVSGVVLCKSKSAPLSAAALKASAGLAEHLDIFVAPSLKSAVLDLKKAGYTFYMALLDGKNATSVTFTKPACLVIGNEAVGITKDIRSLGNPITLPQRSSDISYNASVAAGILLFLMATQLQALKS
jgi:23S rRNA (guanosine2251-2'-O)-methyltransferase